MQTEARLPRLAARREHSPHETLPASHKRSSLSTTRLRHMSTTLLTGHMFKLDLLELAGNLRP